tara:strand:- start:710 stop:916 length:207 start_codon:yes stop_codon:yes gene_type:complete
MVEIQELIIKAKVNSDFEYSKQDVIKIIRDEIRHYVSKNEVLSQNDKKKLIDDCLHNVLYEIENRQKL